jgi:tetratricopeptide (TPR) repeat protein
MTGRGLYIAALLAILAANAYGGIAKIIGFYHRFHGERTLVRAEMDVAFEHLTGARAWQPRDETGHLMMARLVHLSQANGLRVEGLKGLKPEEVLHFGLDAAAYAIRTSPSDAWAWFHVAEVYRGYQSARKRMERMVAAGRAAARGATPTVATPAVSAGPEPEDGIVAAAALKAQGLDPDFYFYHDYIARLYWKRGLQSEAEAEARQAFALMPQPEAHPMLDDAEPTQGLGEAILEGIDTAGSNPFIDPLVVARSRADMLERLGRADEAIAAFEELRTLGDEDLEAVSSLHLARLYQGQGKYKASVDLLHRVREIEQGGTRALALYYLGLAHARLGEHEEAVQYLRRYLTKRTGTLRALMMLAGELEALGERTEAERYYVALVDRFPGEPEPYVKLIGLLRSQRRIGEALAYAERFRSENPGDPTVERLIRRIEEDL